ncbi:hypothetical protein L8O12_00410 [Enterobacter kobei]|nr:primase-like DNA-binding domain-containing protein [Enterobacter kobei]MCK7153921.1 hypothetical protein [Enterobacter kobei]MCK7215142.1 hypothetical protein [Enterobacter kobei]UOY65300.1 hypothetical protein LCD42_16245 [Enterobacter kobei]
MFNLQTLTAKARELRGNVVKATTTKGTRTMTPVYEREEQRKLRERIQQTQPDWVLLWWDIATVTGWRTSDVCNFRYSCINWETGIATIIVAKQTKAAEARATRKGIEIVRQQRKDAARLAGDHIGYMHWDSVSCDELAAGMTEEEQAIVFELVAKAEVKHDTKQLPPGIIKRLRERMERNLIGDDLVFSRSQIESNRCQSLEGSVSRQTIWKKLHNVMVWFTRVVNTRLRLSAYSSRKIAAFNLMSAGGEQGLLVASEMLGHSNNAVLRAVVVATNNTPMIFTERAGGVSRRRVIFQFNRRVSEEDKDPDLAEKISAEIPVVVRRLLANFADPEKARALLLEQRNSEEALEVKQKTDPLYAFCAHLERLADCVGMLVGNRNPPHRPRMYLYHAYLKFLEANGFEKPLTLNKFSEGMESAMREFNHEYRKERKTRGVVTNVELSESAEDWLPQAHPLAEDKR